MYNFDALNQFNDFSQAALERFVRLNQISAAAVEKLTKQHAGRRRRSPRN